MRRQVFGIFSAMSAIVFVLAAMLWASTPFADERFSTHRYDPIARVYRVRQFVLADGRFWYGDFRLAVPAGQTLPPPAIAPFPWTLNTQKPPYSWLGTITYTWSLYQWVSTPASPLLFGQMGIHNEADTLIGVRLLPLMLVSFVLPACWLGILRAHRRRARVGLCSACGYDQRATPLSGGAMLGRCPECGMIPPVAASTKVD